MSVGSGPRPYLFTFPVRYTTVRPPVHTTPKCGTEPIRYVTLHRLSRSVLRSVAPLQKLRRNHCSYVSTKARFSIRYGVKIALVVTFISVHNGNMKNASTARAIEFDHSLSNGVSVERLLGNVCLASLPLCRLVNVQFIHCLLSCV